jgi:hypothetical protein
MLSFQSIAVILILAWTCCYSISYGVWTWKKKNPFGALAIFALTAAAVLISLYTAFILHG